MLEKKEINLDLPVDAYDAEGNLKEKPLNISEEDSTEVSQTKEKEVVEKKEEDEEQRVPYSRFSKIRERAEQAEQEAEEARELLRAALSRKQEVSQESHATSSYDEDYAREVKRLYGDTPEAQEIIAIQTRQMRAIEERAERRALDAVARMRESETQALTQNENVIDQRLARLEDSIGRELSEKEMDAVLSIVDEYTPTGEDGKYLGEILPFDKAWEVYELRQEKQSLSSKKNRSAALAASNTRSHGEPSETRQANTDFDPRNWNSLYNRIGRI